MPGTAGRWGRPARVLRLPPRRLRARPRRLRPRRRPSSTPPSTAERPGLHSPWVSIPAPALTGISCPTAQLCLAVGLSGSASGGIVLITRDAGASWTAGAIPAGATVITSVQCPSAIDCTVIATDGTTFWSAHSVDFGNQWQRGGSLPAGLQDAGSLTCVTGGPCLVTGFTATTAGHGQGAIVVSGDGGTTWTAANVPTEDRAAYRAWPAPPSPRAWPQERRRRQSAPSSPPRGEMLTSQDGGKTWTDLPPAHRSTTSSGSHAPRRSSAPWWAPNGSAARPSAQVGWRRVTTAGAPSSRRRPNTCPFRSLRWIARAHKRASAWAGTPWRRLCSANAKRRPHPPPRPHRPAAPARPRRRG